MKQHEADAESRQREMGRRTVLNDCIVLQRHRHEHLLESSTPSLNHRVIMAVTETLNPVTMGSTMAKPKKGLAGGIVEETPGTG